MAAFAVVLAIGIFWWSSRTMKNNLKRQNEVFDNRPVEYETRKHWADHFDDDNK